MEADNPFDGEALLKTIRYEANPQLVEPTKRMLTLLGANLLLFNQIELVFKKILPDLRPIDGRLDADPLQAILSSLDKQPLGNVAKLLTSLFDPGSGLGFGAYLAQVVDRRNQIVHHFLQVPGVSLVGEGPEFAARWLKEQFDFCLPLKTMADQLLVSVLYAKERAAAARGEELAVEEWRDHWK